MPRRLLLRDLCGPWFVKSPILKHDDWKHTHTKSTCSSPRCLPKSRTPQMCWFHWWCEHRDCRGNVEILGFVNKVLVPTAISFSHGSKHTACSKRPQSLLFPPTLLFSLNFHLKWVFCSESIGKFRQTDKIHFRSSSNSSREISANISTDQHSLRRFDLTFIYLATDAWIQSKFSDLL